MEIQCRQTLSQSDDSNLNPTGVRNPAERNNGITIVSACSVAVHAPRVGGRSLKCALILRATDTSQKFRQSNKPLTM